MATTIEFQSIGEHLRQILMNIDTLQNPVELPSSEIDARLADLSTRLGDFVDAIRDYDFNSTYHNSPLYLIVADVENLVYQVPYSERSLVRNRLFSVSSVL